MDTRVTCGNLLLNHKGAEAERAHKGCLRQWSGQQQNIVNLVIPKPRNFVNLVVENQ